MVGMEKIVTKVEIKIGEEVFDFWSSDSVDG